MAGAMGLFIYAGSMQYVAISLLTAAMTAFVVNARHLFCAGKEDSHGEA